MAQAVAAALGGPLVHALGEVRGIQQEGQGLGGGLALGGVLAGSQAAAGRFRSGAAEVVDDFPRLVGDGVVLMPGGLGCRETQSVAMAGCWASLLTVWRGVALAGGGVYRCRPCGGGWGFPSPLRGKVSRLGLSEG